MSRRPKHRNDRITALYADPRGGIFDASNVCAAARIGSTIVRLQPSDLIPLPDAADLMFLPDHPAVGFAPDGQLITLEGNAVSAILPAGFTRSHLPASDLNHRSDKPLPLFGYAAVALYHDQLYVAAINTDENFKWNPDQYNSHDLRRRIKQVKNALPDNRLVEHLAHCSLEWHCLTAQNLFYHRWEAGLPASPTCNARCLGCISLQEAECCPSPQSRITFQPTVEEITDIAVYHLRDAPDAIISFGQGCEGEPSLSADRIAQSIINVREQTPNGMININSNAGFTVGLKKIIDAGLDSIRVSIISARPDSYHAYYRSNYALDDVKQSIRYALDRKVYVSLNLLYLPGFNDRLDELNAWIDFLTELPVDMIQLRNLNIDPDYFFGIMPESNEQSVGTKKFLSTLENKFPHLKIGSFSHYNKE